MANTSVSLVDPFISPSKEVLQDPYPIFAKLREESPVFWSEKGNYWLVTSYEESKEILGDLHFEKGARRFKALDKLAKFVPNKAMLEFRQKSMLNQNPPDHARLRSLVNKAFTPSMISQMRSHIESIAGELIDKIEKKQEFDLVADFSFPLPATVIAEMLGVPVKDRDKFKVWSHALVGVLEPNPRIMNVAKTIGAYKELLDYLKPLVEERRKEKRDDLISALVEAEEDGNRLTEIELLSNTILLLIAGHETTTNLIGNSVYALLRNPEQMETLRKNPDLMRGAVLEFLRFESPVQMVRRIADCEMEIGKKTILPEQQVLVALGAANRDPSMFADPDKLDVTRANAGKHLAFGHGIHHCLGSSLAETEGQIAIDAVLRRIPNIKLKTKKIEYKEPFALRGLKSLPLTTK